MKNILGKSNFGFTKWCVGLRASLLLALTVGWMGMETSSWGQISIPDTSAVTQNFNGIGATTTAPLPSNWKMSAAGQGSTAQWSTVANLTAVAQGASSGSPTGPGSYNWGNGTTTTDRAVGFMSSGSYASPNSVMAYYQNNTGSTITALTIAFDYERYRVNTAAASVAFFTSTDGLNWTAQTSGDSGAFATGASTYNFTSGTVVSKSFSVSGLSIPATGAVYLRWVFNTTGSNSQGIGLDNVSVAATVAANATPPSLTAANSAAVDASFDVAFTDDSAWRNAISSITVNGSNLAPAAYTKSVAGKITFNPSQSTLLQSAGNKSIVVQAAGYSNATVTQPIAAGAATQMAVTTQPTAPSFNGGTLATQPVVTLRDLYGNRSASTANVIVTQGGGGAWALGGGLTVAAIDGVATFNGLTAGHTVALTGATLSFSSGILEPVSSSAFIIPAPVAPTLAAAPSATVDGPFTISFADNSAWRGVITAVRVGSTNLDPSAYAAIAGQITLTPSASILLQTSGDKSISVVAGGYADATVTQTLGAGAATKLVLTTQPVAPATNGGALATQPIVNFADQYDNLTTSGTGDVTAAVGTGSYTLGGNPTISPSAGVATFTDLTAGAATALSGVTISFSSGSLTGVTSGTFNIPAPLAPTLAAAVSATVDADFVVTYPANSNWQNVVTGVTVGGQALDGAAFFVANGQITFKPSASTLLQSAGSKTIAVIATGYSDATVTQPVGAGVATKLAITTQPTAPSTNGGVLAAQPVVRFQDQYSNNTTGTADVTAAPANGGTWTLGGITTVTPASDIATFSGLTAANSVAALTGAAIEFSAAGVQSATSNTFDIPTPPPANDLAENATTLPLDGTAVSGTMVQATVSAPFAGVSGGVSLNVSDVWYQFTPSQSGAIFIQANTTSSALDLFVYADPLPPTVSSSSTGSLTLAGGSAVASSTAKKTTVFVQSGQKYFVRVALNSAANTAQAFTISALGNFASPLLAWDFFGEGSSTSGVVSTSADFSDPNLDSNLVLSRGTGAAASNAGNSFRTTGFSNNGINTTNTDYFEFQMSADPGRKMSLQNIVIKVLGTNTYMNSPGVEMQFAYSLDRATFTLIGSSVSTMDSAVPFFDLSSISALQGVPANTTVTFRYYASGQTGTGGWGFNSPAAGQYGLYVTGTTVALTAPSNIALSLASIQENNSANAVVGNLSATDVDAGDVFTYALVAGAGGEDNGSFNISGNQLRATSQLNFEAKSSYSVLVQVTDSGGLTYSKPFTITVTNVNESPTDIGLTPAIIPENSAVDTVVGTFSTTDVDSGDIFTYSLVAGEKDVDNASFNISGNSLRTSARFDFETKSSYNVRVRATDSANNTFEKAFTIRVEDLPEALTYSSWLGVLTPSDAAFLDYVFGAVAPGTLNPTLKPSVAVADGNLVLTYHVRQGTVGLTVTPKTSADLAAGPSGWVTTDVTIANVGAAREVNGVIVQQKTASVPVSGTKKFLKVEAVQE